MVSIKQFIRFIPGFTFVNIQIPMNQRNSPNAIEGSLMLLLVSTRMTSLTKLFNGKRGDYFR